MIYGDDDPFEGLTTAALLGAIAGVSTILLVVAIACWVLAGCGGNPMKLSPRDAGRLSILDTGPTDHDTYEQSLLILVNVRRLELQLPALITTTTLMEVAEAHSQEMAANNYLAHANLAGLHGDGRLTEAGYRWRWWGEAIAGGSATPTATLEGWLNSPTHKVILLDGRYTEIGLGFAYDETTKYWSYWTIVVARPAQ